MPLTFPTLSQGQDSSLFSVETDDPAIKADIEGGYEYTRPRFTRRPRRTFKTGFSDLTEADRTLLDEFYDDVMGGSDSFYWTNPVTSVVTLVRFKDPPTWKYTGIKTRYRWQVQFAVKEV